MKLLLKYTAFTLWILSGSAGLTLIVLGIGQGLFGLADRFYSADALYGTLGLTLVLGIFAGAVVMGISEEMYDD